MKKTTFLILFLSLAVTTVLMAQTYYVGTDTNLTGDDRSSSSSFSIGFTFNYYGTDYTNFDVSTNSVLALGGSPSTSYSNSSLPSGSFSNPVLLPFWDDLMSYGICGDGGDKDQPILYKTIGSAPNRQLIVQWTNYGYFSSDLPMGTFQIILEETTNVIYFQYLELNSSRSRGESATVGIQSAGGTYHEQVLHNTSSLSEGQAISFTPSGATDYTVNTSASFANVRLARTLTPPEAATLSTPSNNATGVSITPNFDWSDATNATSYDFLVATDNQFTNVVISETGLTSSQAIYGTDYNTVLSGKTKYYWLVISKKDCESTYSDIFSFTTKPVVSVAGTGSGSGTITGDVNAAAAPAQLSSRLTSPSANEIDAAYNGSSTTGDKDEAFIAGITTIQLSATPAASSNFTGWALSGITPSSSTDNPLTLNPAGDSGNVTATATFTLKTYTISGNISDGSNPISGVTVTFSHDSSTATTNVNGDYSKVVVYGTNTILTPAKAGYTFTPTTATFNNVTSNQTQDFTGALIPVTVSGTVLASNGNPLSGVTLTFSHDGSTVTTASDGAHTNNVVYDTTTTAPDGTYTKNVVYGTTTTITPTLNNYSFTPESTTLTNITTPQTANFTGESLGGSVQVYITPADAVSAGAMWNLDGGGWRENGSVAGGVKAGQHTVNFKQVDGWDKPSSQSVLVKVNQKSTTSGNYTADPWYNTKPKIHYFSANPEIIGENDSTLLKWSTSGADSISIDQGVGGGLNKEGSRSVTPGNSTTYTLTATNAYGSSRAQVKVQVRSLPKILWFESTNGVDNPINSKGTAILDWGVRAASKVTIATNGASPSETEKVDIKTGLLEVSPDATTTYVLTASNEIGEVTDTAIVAVEDAPKITSFTAYPTKILEGENATLSWTIDGASKAELTDNGSVNTKSGSKRVSPESAKEYTLTASNNAGSDAKALTIDVEKPAEACDLKVELLESVATSQSNDLVGVSKSYTLKVENAGPDNAKKVGITLSSKKGIGDSANLRKIKAGSSKTVMLNYLPLVGGKHKIKVIVDPAGLNADSDRNNNSMKIRDEFLMLTGIDLLCTKINARLAPEEGEGYGVISFNVYNGGTAKSDGFQWQVWVSDDPEKEGNLLTQGNVDSLNSGKEFFSSEIIDLTKYKKNIYVKVIVDAYSAISETNEANNIKVKKFKIKNIK